MVLLGLGLLIASVSFLCYRHSPAEWWGFLERLRPVTGTRDAGKREDVGSGGRGGDEEMKKDRGRGGGEDSSRPLSNEATTSENEENGENAKMERSTDAPSMHITEPLQDATIIGSKSMPPPILPPPSKAALDRAAMPPPPPPLFKKPAHPNKTPSSPTTPRAPPSPNTNILSPSTPLSPLPAASRRTINPTTKRPPNFSRRSSRVPPQPFPPQPHTHLLTHRPIPRATPTHTSIPTKPRKKVLLTPNHSPLDWARLTTSPNSNLRGLPPSTPYLRVPPSLLKQFTGRKGKDAWTVLGGKVYNITPYLPYHPGGEPELMKCAGRDGTRLFGEVHPWGMNKNRL
ncbi:fb493716-3ba4-4861-9a52-d995629728ba-CDS [Sclerotinia trifoliorum]|uniref:Fb493716-3ba4-4861-9a52-d995629728ba-CDS n=1 Tax=Sclerotinia trifoliorum TaxID=28548 RepID=A0A8H2VXK3_9HELO|nr:fb493716-3ba4-4861-9a52-d995629728ba-CDS [Sclerotinia trifoliorum]